jgi:hypothetical protein
MYTSIQKKSVHVLRATVNGDKKEYIDQIQLSSRVLLQVSK